MPCQGQQAQHKRHEQEPALGDKQQFAPADDVSKSPRGEAKHEDGQAGGRLHERH
jgi:hypothetical protein